MMIHLKMSGSNKSCNILSSIGAVRRSGNTVDMVTRAAIPVGKGTTSIRASGLIGSTLLLASHLHQLLLLGNEGAVSSSGSTEDVVTAAVPVGIGAASSRASGLIGSTLLLASHLHELLPLGNKGTVRSRGSTEDVVRAAVTVFLRATSHGAPNLTIIALFRFQKF